VKAPKKQHPSLQRIGHGNHCGRRSTFPIDAEYLVFLVKAASWHRRCASAHNRHQPRSGLSIRPSTPPVSLIRLKAVSIPSFIWRPSSLEAPENGAAIPNRFLDRFTPRTGEPAPTCATGAVGAVAAAAEDGAITAATLGPGPAPAIDRSRSASCRSADLQSVLPVVTAPTAVATLRSNACVRSERSASLTRPP